MKTHFRTCLAVLVPTLLLSAAEVPGADDGAAVLSKATLADVPLGDFQKAWLPTHPLTNDHGFFLGGLGSDLWRDADAPESDFWMITDRGPNGEVKAKDGKRRTFPVPDFAPALVQVRIAGNSFSIVRGLPLTTASGRPVLGLPNLPRHDEKPYAGDAVTPLAYDVNGLDPEAMLHVPGDGFWIAEEYAPSLLHVDESGRVLKRYVPEGLDLAAADYPVAAVLPAILSQRKANRGFESIARDPATHTLFLILQSPLANPDKKAGERSRAVRILAFDPAAERATAEYVFELDPPTAYTKDKKREQDDVKISAAAWLGENRLLVLERTDEAALLFQLDLTNATNLLGSPWDDSATAPALEQLADLPLAGVKPAAKRLILDLSTLPGVSSKIEGLAVLGPDRIAVANDNDFDIGTLDASGRNQGSGTKTRILLIRVPGLR
jgi:hypothetical protein